MGVSRSRSPVRRAREQAGEHDEQAGDDEREHDPEDDAAVAAGLRRIGMRLLPEGSFGAESGDAFFRAEQLRRDEPQVVARGGGTVVAVEKFERFAGRGFENEARYGVEDARVCEVSRRVVGVVGFEKERVRRGRLREFDGTSRAG